MVMIGDENGDDFVSVTTYSQMNANPNPGKTIARLLLRTVHEESKAPNRRSWVSLNHATW
jgi:hypothetical protein